MAESSSDRVEAIRELLTTKQWILSHHDLAYLLRLHDEDQARIAALEQQLTDVARTLPGVTFAPLVDALKGANDG